MSKNATILDSQNITVSGNTLSTSIIQSISNSIYNKTEVNGLSTTFRNGLATTAQLTAYETKADLTSNYYNKTATNNLSTTFRSGLATTAQLTAYLPKSGGTMTGSIITNKLGAMYYADDMGYLHFSGSNLLSSGAYIRLFGNNFNSTLSGGAQIVVHDAAGAIRTLSYYGDGKLKVNGDNVVISVNGTKADNYGNVTLNSNCIATINGTKPDESGNFNLNQLSVINSSLIPDEQLLSGNNPYIS